MGTFKFGILKHPTVKRVRKIQGSNFFYITSSFTLKHITIINENVKVKQSHYRTGQALRVPGG
jgi:hypothetical protein